MSFICILLSRFLADSTYLVLFPDKSARPSQPNDRGSVSPQRLGDMAYGLRGNASEQSRLGHKKVESILSPGALS